MKPKKEILDKAMKEGAIDRAANMIALSYVTLSCANSFIGEADDIMERYGLLVGELRQAHNAFVKSADRYFRVCCDIFNKNVSVNDYFHDLENLESLIRKWSGINSINETKNG